MATDTHWIVDPAATSIVFGRFRLLPMQRLLTEAGTPVHLGSRAFDILLALVERAGELVTKEELMARAWPNTFVAPANLAVHIMALRRALADGRDGNRYVVNIPGRGYRFVAAVTFEKSPRSQPVAEPAYEAHWPGHSPRAAGRAEMVHAAGQQPRFLNVVGPDGTRNTAIAFALIDKLTHEQGFWLVGLGPAGHR